jgi:uncharacterized protein
MSSNLRDKLNFIGKDHIKKKWKSIDSQGGISTKEKLEKLVNLTLKREKTQKSAHVADEHDVLEEPGSFESEKDKPVIVREFSYPMDAVYGKCELEEWKNISTGRLAVIFGDEACEGISPMSLVFFDTETTGLSGGTGTIPFLLGFGFFEDDRFRVKIFILNDLYKEDEFLEEVDRFLAGYNFTGVVTYNGKSFDFPLMETRYILQRKRFPLLALPHLDFLFSARTIWKHTYDSRKLGHLGDILLGISREDDIDASRIPAIYFNYLRIKSFLMMEKVVEHNAADLLGLAALLLLAVKYQEDISYTSDEGEILGIAKLFEKHGDFEEADRLYEILKQSAVRKEVKSKAIDGLALSRKRKKLYKEASELWEMVAGSGDHRVVKELSVHFEHREKDYVKALEYVQNALDTFKLTEAQRNDFEKRLERLTKKLRVLDKEE